MGGRGKRGHTGDSGIGYADATITCGSYLALVAADPVFGGCIAAHIHRSLRLMLVAAAFIVLGVHVITVPDQNIFKRDWPLLRFAMDAVSWLAVLFLAPGEILVVEGIDTQAALDYLRARGSQLGQGYYFSRPLAPAALEE